MSPWSPRFISSTNSGRRFDNIDIDWLLSKASSSVFLSAQNHIKQQFRPPSSQRGRVCWAHWADAECSRPAVPSFHHSHLCLTRIRMWFQTRGILAARGYPKARPVMRARRLGMVCQDSPPVGVVPEESGNTQTWSSTGPYLLDCPAAGRAVSHRWVEEGWRPLVWGWWGHIRLGAHWHGRWFPGDCLEIPLLREKKRWKINCEKSNDFFYLIMLI